MVLMNLSGSLLWCQEKRPTFERFARSRFASQDASDRIAIHMRSLFVLALIVTSCTGNEPSRLNCVQSLRKESGADLSLQGSGGCDTSLRLSLRVATGSRTEPSWTPASGSVIKVSGEWTRVEGGVARSVEIENTSGQDVEVVGLEWSSGEDGLALQADRMLHNGYQSWSYTGVEAIPTTLTDVSGTAAHGGDNEDLTSEKQGVSWWFTSVAGKDGRGITAGADGGTVFKTYLAVNAAPSMRMRIVQGVTGDSLVLKPGERRQLDGLYVALGDSSESLENYAAYIATKNLHETPLLPPLGGWGSWNVYYEHPTAELLALDLGWAEVKLAPLGLTDFLLDDGYETHWGSWEASTTYGSTLPAQNAEQIRRGFRPAIWLAPFYVDVTDPRVASRPELFVHNFDGTLRTYNNFGPEYAVLDVSHADARAFVIKTMTDYRDMGYRTLKIDFLFGGAVEGVRQKPMTGLESYRLWMKTMREAVPEVHLVGCGAPLLPSVGWVDSMRTGPDIAFSVSPQPRYLFVAGQARNNISRFYTDRWWALDPDVVLLRGTAINDAEAWTAIVSAALTGGSYLMGDGRQSSELRQSMALAPEVLAMTRDSVSARPLDWMAEIDPVLLLTPVLDVSGKTKAAHIWQKSSADGKHHWLAVFAWGDETYRTTLDLPENAVELVPPKAEGESVTRKRAGGEHHWAVNLHEVRLFSW